MTYDLAKQLKDAAFPQTEGIYIDCDEIIWDSKNILTCYDKARNLTLSELIEAFPQRWKFELIRAQAGWCAKMMGTAVSQCSTPEEAVAKLWLALHQN
jgi:hypothetical protein